jgi:dolichol-phosphate mannosyltransferase
LSNIFSIVVPVFQNEESLEYTIPVLLSLENLIVNYKLELVFINDGSTDQSMDILIKYAEKYPDIIRIIKLTRNFGQSAATQAGLRYSTGNCVGIISADLQEPSEVFSDMIIEWEKGAKFIIGEREAREENIMHQYQSNIYWTLIRRFAFQNFPTMGYDFCLLDRQIVDDINRINEKNSSIFVLLYWLGYRPVCLPIKRKIRDKGTSQWGFRRKFSFTLDTIIGFTYLPARIITIMGFVSGTLCLLYLGFILYIWYTYSSAPPGWMTVIGLLTLIGSMILFSLGMISEYLIRILDETRKRPPYVAEEFINFSQQIDDK